MRLPLFERLRIEELEDLGADVRRIGERIYDAPKLWKTDQMMPSFKELSLRQASLSSVIFASWFA